MDSTSWAEEETPPPPTDEDAPAEYDDPTSDIEPWELTTAESRIYEAGFMSAYAMRTAEIERLTREVEFLNHENDRLYRAAFDHRNCACWKGHRATTKGTR